MGHDGFMGFLGMHCGLWVKNKMSAFSHRLCFITGICKKKHKKTYIIQCKSGCVECSQNQRVIRATRVRKRRVFWMRPFCFRFTPEDRTLSIISSTLSSSSIFSSQCKSWAHFAGIMVASPYPPSRIVHTAYGSVQGRRLVYEGERQVDAFQASREFRNWSDHPSRAFPSPLRRSGNSDFEWVSLSWYRRFIGNPSEAGAFRPLEWGEADNGLCCPMHSASEEPAGLFYRELKPY